MSTTVAAMPVAARRYGAWGWLAAAGALAVLPGLIGSDSMIGLFCAAGIAVIFAASYNILLGRTGLLSFGHAVFYGLGGFGVIHAMNAIAAAHWPMPVAFLPLLGGVIGLAAGAAIGSLASKRSGIVFAMITFGFGELVSTIAPILTRFFGGEGGVTTDRSMLQPLFGWDFGPQIQVYYLVCAWSLLSLAAIRHIGRTAFGKIASAARHNPERIEFIGYNLRRVRFTAICLASFFAGVAGGLTAINYEIMTTTNVGSGQSTTVVLATYIGGIDFFAGPIIGAVLITFMQSLLSDITPGWPLYLGLLFVVVVMYAPDGIAGLLFGRGQIWRDRIAPRRLLLLLPMAALAAGVILAIELGYQLESGTGSVRRLAGIAFDAAQAWPWIAAAVLALGGAAVLQHAGQTGPRVMRQ